MNNLHMVYSSPETCPSMNLKRERIVQQCLTDTMRDLGMMSGVLVALSCSPQWQDRVSLKLSPPSSQYWVSG